MWTGLSELFNRGAKVTFAKRAGFLKKVASEMRSRRDKLARLTTEEMGKRFAECKEELALSAKIVEYYAENDEEFLEPQRFP